MTRTGDILLPLFESTLFQNVLLDAPTALRRAPASIPLRQPAPGEQYRFHFDMTQVHRLQVLRGGLQRAERQSRGDQLAARGRNRRRRTIRTRSATISRWAAITAWSLPA